ncbi:MAG: hypothetical protein CO158_00675 [Piscirickettsiaceae bacterium CG_4_9_14_3_um_filter_43_564]|nr:MAG: hypothetical protein COW74_06360 [Piscirickettsiaceae bacterium CG18_big_fil_WC_8_21_14_2_50_44_103]PIU39671.1 MAG: hypothetical protein COT01_00155 [Piscirickettsiaceae bacterium CG07_land_8_20_14_0_80_44_28]PIW57971.1 MAG: hypothetical protein COW14_03170 [Piscirickettsiaceae bacterium CG12_big_fil_rev_8_21_14_0_65_44_934]PIY76055.1 MAG: hypothetical protein COY84_08035 [Piscirickettsiaceae bacterium CG_4_10_14_0_8_um_filter_44_742]PIZ73737.1 MAG: hypothetical protein COY08_05065 [Pis
MNLRASQLLITLLSLTFFTAAQANEPKPIDQVTVVGINPLKQSLNSVRRHLWNIGGFKQATFSVRKRNVDKFFAVNRLLEIYYLEFYYDNAGRITTIYQLYRPTSHRFSESVIPTNTRDLAQKMMQQIGEPTRIEVKGSSGSPNYAAYIWQDDKITVKIDREDNDAFGNIFVQYTVNQRDPYLVTLQ